MLRGVITYRGSPEVKAKAFRLILKEQLREIVDFWHEKYLPRHFTKVGARDYKYKERSSTHMKKKIRQFHHDNPLVYSGDMKRLLERRIAISGTSKKAVGRLTGPRYLYQYRKDYNQPHKADEVTRVVQPEVLVFARRLDKKMTKRINAIKTTQTKRF